jgi:hypothetical protein
VLGPSFQTLDSSFEYGAPGPGSKCDVPTTYAPACRRRAPTSASSLSLDEDGVSPPGVSVAFLALNTRTHRPAAQASSISSSAHACPRACA